MSYLIGRDHLVVDVAGFGAFGRKEFVVVVEVFDLPVVSEISRKEGGGLRKYHYHRDQRGTVV